MGNGKLSFEEDEEHQVWLDKNYLILRGLGLEIHSGVWYEKYEDDKDGNFEPDFDFYMFFDAETKVYLYMEQGVPDYLYPQFYRVELGRD